MKIAINRSINPARVAKIIVWIVMLAILIGGITPVLAQGGGGGDIGATVNDIVNSIVSIIQNITIGLAVLGLAIWALGKVTRSYFPQLSQMTANYITEFIIGIVVIFAATKIVQGIANAVGAGGGN